MRSHALERKEKIINLIVELIVVGYEIEFREYPHS
jgi:hypothetical protein